MAVRMTEDEIMEHMGNIGRYYKIIHGRYYNKAGMRKFKRLDAKLTEWCCNYERLEEEDE